MRSQSESNWKHGFFSYSVLTSNFVLQVVDLRGDPLLTEGYIKEVKILASLQDKDNVIRLYE